MTEQPPSSSSDLPTSILLDQGGSPEPSTPAVESDQTTHHTPSSLMPGLSQTMATTKSPANPNEPIQKGEDGSDGKDENGHVVEQGSPLLTLPASALADIVDIIELQAMDDSEIQEIGSDSKQAGSSQHTISKKEKLEVFQQVI